MRSLLDIPCGDGLWMSATDLPVDLYIGADIVESLVRANQRRLRPAAAGRRRYCRLDLTRDELPQVDLILCRDGLVHFSDADVFRALRQIRSSGSHYLLTTTFPERSRNRRIVAGDRRPLNLQRPPFQFGPPLAVLPERCAEEGGRYADKSLGLWRIRDLSE